MCERYLYIFMDLVHILSYVLCVCVCVFQLFLCFIFMARKTILQSANNSPPPPFPSPSILHSFSFRFQIEDVEETHLVSHQNSLTENMADITISSLGYNTAEAVPMTVYYRKSGEGNTRPTLENLRQGRTEKPTVEQLAVR